MYGFIIHFSFVRYGNGRPDALFGCECIAGRSSAINTDPAQYVISLEQMIENQYPIPSYMADIFQKPPGWVETPEPPPEPLLSQPSENEQTKIYAIDCEMACITLFHP